jgi:NitT/TauT family transport system substrate-binding protein
LDYDKVWREGKYTTAVVIARKKFIEDNPDIVEKFVKTHVELTEYITNNKEKAKETVNNQIKELTQKPLAKDILDSAFSRLTVTYDPEKESISGFADLSVNTGFLKEKPDLKDLYDLGPLNKALKEKGLTEVK